MKKNHAIVLAVIIGVALSGWSCKQNGSGMEDFAGALNLQYESYRILKENRDEPARAGKLFTQYYQKNRAAMSAAFKRYYKKYGDGSGLTKDEAEFLDGEMRKVNALLSDEDIKKVMNDPAFIEEAREGTAILNEVREAAK